MYQKSLKAFLQAPLQIFYFRKHSGGWGWGQQVMRNSPLFQKILGCIINIFREQAFCNHKI